VLGGTLHVLGGYINGRAHSRTHLAYDLATRRWHRAAPLPAALDHIGAVAIGTGASGRILAIGGYGSAGRPTAGVYAYDRAADRWSSLAPLPVPRAAGVAVFAAGLVHYIGGRTPNGDTGEHDVYDPATNRWSLAAPMPTARDHAAAAVVGDAIYVAAGRPGGLRTLESYDLRTGRWTTELPALPLGRSSVAGAAWRGQFIVLGGENAAETTAYREVDAYNPSRRKWTRLTPLPAPRQGIGAAVVGDALMLPGGGPAAGPAHQTNTLLVLR
jgi:N-acetylneuraminic acid mutarotase